MSRALTKAQHALVLVARYNLSCEFFAALVCRKKDADGLWSPEGLEKAEVGALASVVNRALRLRAVALGITAKDIAEARATVVGWSRADFTAWATTSLRDETEER